jgi:CRP-like cAMP-binding protein
MRDTRDSGRRMRPSCTMGETAPMAVTGLLGVLTPADRRSLWATMTRRRFSRNETIFRAGDAADAVYIIVKGHVALRVSAPRGDTVTLRVLGRDALFGEYALISPAPRAATAVTLDAAETMRLHRDDFAHLRAEHPQLDAFLLEAAINEVRRLSAALLDALHAPVEQRVRSRLAEVARLYEPGEPIPLSQQGLAELAGATRQSVNRALANAQENGTLRIGRATIEILKPHELSD